MNSAERAPKIDKHQDPAVDLALDVGNSRTKAALFHNGRIVRSGTVRNGDPSGVDAFIAGTPCQAIVIGSVAQEDTDFLEALRQRAPILVISGDSPAPVATRYDDPATLGADRLANAVCATLHFPGRPVLVIDAGTCITYDLVDASGEHIGGAISPGMRMRAEAMHAYSARLPLVDAGEAAISIGASTRSSLLAGIRNGILGEMRTTMESYGHEHPGMAVILTGGDGLRWAKALKNGIFALPYATLEGLYAILLHHRARHGAGARDDAHEGDGPRHPR